VPPRHLLLALAVVAVWGTNFVVVRHALDVLPPLTLAALRFALAFVPAAFFVARPKVPWRVLATYGALIGAGQFGLMFYAMRADITPGLTAVVIQTQVFFTIGLAMALRGERAWPLQSAHGPERAARRIPYERVTRAQVMALLLSGAGLAVIAIHVDASTTPLGLALVLIAALAWAGGNTVAQRAGPLPILGFMVWSSLFALPPLLAMALVFEGPAAMAQGVRAAGWGTWLAVLWQAAGNTLFGYGAWAWLLARHPAATVSPLALLVPVFGLGSSALLLGEALPAWKLVAAALVIGGLALNLLLPRLTR
jgi:O-acetylserine/cysteine efflux transporter